MGRWSMSKLLKHCLCKWNSTLDHNLSLRVLMTTCILLSMPPIRVVVKVTFILKCISRKFHTKL